MPCRNGWCALVGIGLDTNPGAQTISVQRGRETADVTFEVKPKHYEEQHITLKDKGMVDLSPEDLARYERDKEATTRAFTTWSDAEPLLQLALPASGEVSGNFGLKRFFNGQPRASHSGLDIAAPYGATVRAPAPGLIVMYNHLSVITAKVGAHVETGDKIGEVGKTGRVTGPHLHWGVSLNNQR